MVHSSSTHTIMSLYTNNALLHDIFMIQMVDSGIGCSLTKFTIIMIIILKDSGNLLQISLVSCQACCKT